MMTYDPLYIQFFVEFNVHRDYFECHEVMEQLWLEEGRSLFYQGLLQIAVGLYHHHNGNRSGALKLLSAALDKLQPYRNSTSYGVDLNRLLDDTERYREQLLAEKQGDGRAAAVEPYHLDIAITDPELLKRVRENAAGAI